MWATHLIIGQDFSEVTSEQAACHLYTPCSATSNQGKWNTTDCDISGATTQGLLKETLMTTTCTEPELVLKKKT